MLGNYRVSTAQSSPAQHRHIILNQSNKSQTCGEQLRGETAATAVPRQISSYTSFRWNKTAMETLWLGINLILETCVVCMSHYWLSIEYCYEFKAAYILDEAMWYVDAVFWRVCESSQYRHQRYARPAIAAPPTAADTPTSDGELGRATHTRVSNWTLWRTVPSCCQVWVNVRHEV